MTREEIISMAREADISLEFPNGFVFEALDDYSHHLTAYGG